MGHKTNGARIMGEKLNTAPTGDYYVNFKLIPISAQIRGAALKIAASVDKRFLPVFP